MQLKHIITVIFSSVLLSCAGTDETADPGVSAAETGRADCILSGSIRDYRVLDDANLVVTAGAKRRYHVTLARRAIGLRSSSQIGFKSSTGSICAGFGELIVDDVMGLDRYRIQSIRQLTPEEYERLLVRFGEKEPEIEQTPAPEDIEGAEVEELD